MTREYRNAIEKLGINPDNIEIRSHGSLEIKAAEDSPGIIEGYAAKYNKLSENLGGFVEILLPGSLRLIPEQDQIKAFYYHDTHKPLGSLDKGTLKLTFDDVGLFYSIVLPDTQTGRDLAVSINRGDIRQSSFGLIVHKENWKEENGTLIREVVEAEVFEVSPVVYPAYPDTSVALRNLKQFSESKQIKIQNQIETIILRTKILQLRNKYKKD